MAINSSDIKVFPAIQRKPDIDFQSQLTTEHNLTGIIRSIYKRDSFVISDFTPGTPFEFVINGYYFNISTTSSSTISSITGISSGSLYANILLSTTSNVERLSSWTSTETSLDNQENIFTGLSFSNEPVSSSTGSVYSLLLGNISEGTLCTPKTSKLFWNTSDLDIKTDTTTSNVLDTVSLVTSTEPNDYGTTLVITLTTTNTPVVNAVNIVDESTTSD